VIFSWGNNPLFALCSFMVFPVRALFCLPFLTDPSVFFLLLLPFFYPGDCFLFKAKDSLVFSCSFDGFPPFPPALSSFFFTLGSSGTPGWLFSEAPFLKTFQLFPPRSCRSPVHPSRPSSFKSLFGTVICTQSQLVDQHLALDGSAA